MSRHRSRPEDGGPSDRCDDRESRLRAALASKVRENASLTSRLERQQALLQRLLRIQQLISSSAPLQSILDEIVSSATALIGDEAGNIRLQDPTQPDRLILAGRLSEPAAAIAKVDSIRTGEGCTGRAFREERLVIVEDYARAAGTNPAYQKSGLEACMATPVRENGRVIGVLVVATQRKGRRYSSEEQEMLLAFAEHASLALTDAQRVSAVEHMAFFDTLTGLPNRAQFMQRLNQALERARDNASRVAVLFIDVDQFKIVNDSLGHAAGDLLLEVIGHRLSEGIRTDDIAARLGGDEFAVLLEGVAEDDALARVVLRLLTVLNAPAVVAGHTITVSASVGTATSDGSHDAADLLRNADLAMYAAKMEGRRRSAAYDVSMHSQALARLNLEEQLRQAIAADQFELEYQPILALDCESIRGVEALVRWHHPTRGVVGPSEFIPIAEETGLMVPIGRWVRDTATRQVASWHTWPRWSGLELAVNVSARGLRRADFVAEVEQTLTCSGLDPTALVLEITESTILGDSPGVRERLHDLKALGVRLALDDFGTGYSSLAHLRELPVDIIKIDRSFVSDLGTGADAEAMVAAIVGLARALDIEVVAEGIETREQAVALLELGCRLGQGFHYCRPLGAAAMTDVLARMRRRRPQQTRSGDLRGTRLPSVVA